MTEPCHNDIITLVDVWAGSGKQNNESCTEKPTAKQTKPEPPEAMTYLPNNDREMVVQTM